MSYGSNYTKRKTAGGEEVAAIGIDQQKSINIKVVHSLLGQAKSKQKNLPSRSQIVKRVVIKKEVPKQYMNHSSLKWLKREQR
eukprot:10629043-Ditylum_brightwellii.AAC.1